MSQEQPDKEMEQDPKGSHMKVRLFPQSGVPHPAEPCVSSFMEITVCAHD